MSENVLSNFPAVVDTTLPCGLRFVGERMERSQGVALALRIPAGAKDDPLNKFGLACLVKEMLLKGTRRHSARALSDAFDFHGIRYGAATGTESTGIELRFMAEHVEPALQLLQEVLCQPSFPHKEFQTAKTQAVQELKHLEDDPFAHLFVVLKELYMGAEWGHFEIGTESSIAEIERGDLLGFWQARYVPPGSIAAAAGKFEPEALLKKVERLFAHSTQAWPVESPPSFSAPAVKHIKQDTEQTQMALAFPAVPRHDPAYYAGRLALGVLCGGSSGRLWTEIREKRGLVYSIGGQEVSLRGAGIMCVYAGTTTARAAETLKVMRDQLAGLADSLSEDEVLRAKIELKAHLLMDQESTGTRARHLLEDVYHENRAVPLAERVNSINAVGVDEVKSYWATHPLSPYALVTLGREALE